MSNSELHFNVFDDKTERERDPGRIGTVVNDRLRRKTEIYGGRTRTSHTGTVYDVKRSETDSVYGDRVKIRSD